jgi:uncharacterized membrane protein
MKPKTIPTEWIIGAVIFWLLALYVITTGDPTKILLTVRGTYAQREPADIAIIFVLCGTASLCIGLWKRNRKQ